MTLYHATSRPATAAIVEDGFRDTIDRLFGRSGVWFADRWLDDRSHWEAAVTIEVPDADLTSYDFGIVNVERSPDGGKTWDPAPEDNYRAFLIPAAVANRYPRQMLSEATP